MSRTLVHMLHDSVQKWPDSDAIVLGENRITYRQLWETGITVANFLLKNDFKENECVAILLENSPEYVEIYYHHLLRILIHLHLKYSYFILLRYIV